MDYLQSLSISELITYLEIESQPTNFQKVKKILLSREKKTTKRAADLEKNLELYKGKCSVLLSSVEEKSKKNLALEGKLEEFKDYKIICNTLEEKVVRMEEGCKNFSEREASAKRRIVDLECAKRKAEDVIEVQKKRACELERDLEVYKANCCKLSTMLEEGRYRIYAVEGKLEEFMGYKIMCGELQEKVTRLEEGCKNFIEREESTKKRFADLECAKRKAGDEIEVQKKRANELEKDLEMFKANCSKFSIALVQEKDKIIAVEGKLEELKGYKLMCDELQEKVTRLEEDCKNVREREESGNKRISALLDNIKNLGGDRDELKTKNKDLESAKKNAEDEIKFEKERASKLEKDLKMYEANFYEVSAALEEEKHKIVAVEDKLEEFKGYKMMCDELQKMVTCLEEDCKNLKEREESGKERISNLLDDLKNLRWDRNGLETKNKNLELAKQEAEFEIKVQKERAIKLEKDLETYKAHYSVLSTAIEEEKKKTNAVEGRLDELKGYKTVCDELEEKLIHLEEDSKNFREREESGNKRISDLLDDLKNLSWDRNELKTKNKDLESAKQKAEDEIKVQKQRYKKLKTRLPKSKSETSALICGSQASAKANIAVGTEVSNKSVKKDASKLGNIQSETNGGACVSTLKVKLKPLSCVSDGKVCDSAGTESICHSLVKVNGIGQVEVSTPKRKRTLKRKRTRELVNSKGADDDDQIQNGKVKMEHIKTVASGNPIATSTEEKEIMAKRSRREVHPPDRLNL